MNQKQKLKQWVKSLTGKQKTKLLVQLIRHMIQTEDIGFFGDDPPYWRSCGEPLVDDPRPLNPA